GDHVTALVRDPGRAGALGDVEMVRGDLDDAGAVRRGCERADAVFHLAAVYRVGIARGERAAVERANVRGTECVLDAAIDAGVSRIVYVSTINTFGNTRGRVVDEDDRRNVARGFVSWYDRTKYLAHLAAEDRIARGAPIIVALPGGVYGPGDHSEIGSVVDKAMHGRLQFTSFPAMGIVMCHVDDVAGGLVLAHDRGTLGRSYILGGEITTMREIVRAAAAAGGHRPPRLTMPSWAIRAGIPAAPIVTRLMGLPPNLAELVSASDGVTYWATDARARRELGYAPRDLATGMRQLAASAAGARG
ncbi:MAG TPA: NAD-dependent epimerase/dehydratase family protein, partial [Candidatus Dormibacteraeota bacterium]|nr:NAD-dependent epimerase/dehydratase family protein [Candidatus Dormibacteraeota bacterium]